MLTSYHVHSNLSDGADSIPEIVDSAVAAGLDELGISDHYVLLPGCDKIDWSMPLDYLPDYVELTRAQAKRVRGKLTVRCAVEADFDPGSVDELRDVLGQHPFDYVIGSVHYLDGFPMDAHEKHWDDITQNERNDVIRGYWARVSQMARAGLFHFAAHLDIYKKFGHTATVDISDDVISALDAIAQSGMAVEINTAGWHKPVREAYPSSAILSGCARRGIPALVTADAHSIADLTRDYDRATRVLRGVGYTQQAVFAGGKMTLVSL